MLLCLRTDTERTLVCELVDVHVHVHVHVEADVGVDVVQSNTAECGDDHRHSSGHSLRSRQG